ncbi:MAG: hypothetical protein WCT50_04430 [Patescibacteria group bacterium]
MITIFSRKKSFLCLVRLGWILVISLFILVFVILKIVPFGRAVYTKNYSDKFNFGKGFIYNFTPIDKVDTKSGRLPRLIDSTTYFSIFTPRPFSKVKLTIKYKPHLIEDISSLKAGSLVDPGTFYYRLEPLAGSSDSVSVEFDLKGAYRVNGKYGFAIVLPNLKANDTLNDYLEISEVRAEFSGRTLGQKIFGLKD